MVSHWKQSVQKYWNPEYWGLGAEYVQIADINFLVTMNSKQRMRDPREMLKTEPFKIEKSYFTGGLLTTIIQFL